MVDLSIVKEYGYCKKGERLIGERSGQRFYNKRITIMSCINNITNNYVAPLYFEGYTDSTVFKEYCRKILIPELKQIKRFKIKNEEIKLNERLTIIFFKLYFLIIFKALLTINLPFHKKPPI